MGAAGDLALRNARVWPHPDAALTPPQTIVIRDGVIESLADERAVPHEMPQLDVRGGVVTAGFVNCHVHFTEDVWSRSRSAPVEELDAALADMLVSRGFTTVLDLASHPRHTAHLARRIASGELRGPRILSAGAGILPWNAVPYYVRDSLPWYARWMMPGPATALGARLTVAAQARAGAELTKLFTGSYVTPTRVAPMRLRNARAAVAEAHRRGLRVLAHPSDRNGTAIAIAAGVDALAHLPDATDGTEALLADAARRGIRVIPTLHMFAHTVTSAEEYLAPIRAALRGFIAAGGVVLFGTDVGYLSDRSTRAEFEAMHASGMSAADVLRSLTVAPADFLGWRDCGRVVPGARGDLTVLAIGRAVESVESVDPADFADVRSVVREGRVIFDVG